MQQFGAVFGVAIVTAVFNSHGSFACQPGCGDKWVPARTGRLCWCLGPRGSCGDWNPPGTHIAVDGGPAEGGVCGVRARARRQAEIDVAILPTSVQFEVRWLLASQRMHVVPWYMVLGMAPVS